MCLLLITLAKTTRLDFISYHYHLPKKVYKVLFDGAFCNYFQLLLLDKPNKLLLYSPLYQDLVWNVNTYIFPSGQNHHLQSLVHCTALEDSINVDRK